MMKLLEKNIHIIAIILFVKMLILNFLTPLICDDYVYNTSSSIIDVFKQEYHHYMTWGGRSVAHVIIRTFLMMPKAVFNVLNAALYVGLTFLIYRNTASKKKPDWLLYLFIIFSIWLYTIGWGQVTLYISATVNYLWGFSIILCFLTPYHRYIYEDKNFDNKIFPLIGMFFLGMLAGWCNENTSGGAIMFAGIMIIYSKILHKKIEAWMLTGIVGSIIGFLFMVLAPGNYQRISLPPYQTSNPLISDLVERFSYYSYVIYDYFSILTIIFIILLTIQIILFKDWKRSIISIVYFVVAIAVIYAMIFSPDYNARRSMFGATMFMVIACANCFAGISFDKAALKIGVISFISILTFQFSLTFITGFYDIVSSYRAHHRREAYIVEEVQRGNLNIFVPRDLMPRPFSEYNPLYGDVFTAPHINRYYINKFGLESLEMELPQGVDQSSKKRPPNKYVRYAGYED